MRRLAIFAIIFQMLFLPLEPVLAEELVPLEAPIFDIPTDVEQKDAVSTDGNKGVGETIVDTFKKVIDGVAEIINADDSSAYPATFSGEFETLDPLTDIAYLGGGNNIYRFFSAPRLLYRDGLKLKTRESGWNLFNETPETRLKERIAPGYDFVAPLGEKNMRVSAGNYEAGKNIHRPALGVFKQYEKDSATFTEYGDVYSGIDIQFKDNKQYRSKEIIIKQKPSNITKGDTLIFWENYTIPDGAKVYDQNGRLLIGRQGMATTSVFIKTTDGNVFAISDAVVFDATVKNEEQKDTSSQVFPVFQIVEVDYASGELNIGLEINADYILAKERVYPVTIDPTYYFCREGAGDNNNDPFGNILNCNITELYLRYLDDNSILNQAADRDQLFSGYAIDAQGLRATRHAVLRFSNLKDSLPLNVQVTSAKLKMYKNNTQSIGNMNGDVELVVKKIKTIDWGAGNNLAGNDLTYRRLSRPDNNLEVVSNGVSVRNGVAGWKEWNITVAVQSWYGGETNRGMVVEPRPAWLAGNSPNWPQRIFAFDANRKNNQNGPYLEVITTNLPRPDLLDGGSTINKMNFRPGEAINMTNVVRNAGAVASGVRSKIFIYFKRGNGALWDNAYKIAQAEYDSIPAGQERRFATNWWSIPADAVPGNYSIYWWIDPENTVQESNEGNNKSGWFGNIIVENQLPDLTYSDTSITHNTAFPGNVISTRLTVRNNGAGASPAGGRVHYYFSRGDISYADGNKVGEDNFDALGAGGTSPEIFGYQIPQNTQPGTYYFCFWVDARNEVAESNENNNRDCFPAITILAVLDPLEPNNSFDRAYNIGDQNPYSNNQLILTAGDEDWFRFNYNNQTYYFKVWGLGNAAGDYNLSFTRNDRTITIETSSRNGSSPDTFVELYDTDGQSGLRGDDDGAGFPFSRLIYEFPRPGYCNGGCGGGGPPPPAANLPDTDDDSFADVEERLAGTPVNVAVVSAPLFDTRSASYSSKKADTMSIAVPPNQAADPVNTRTGSFEFTQTDFSLPGRGIPINFVRTYNSMTVDKNSRIGNGWNFSHNFFYYQDPATNNVQIYLGGTLATIFTTLDNGQTFSAPKGEFDELYWNNAQHEYLIYKTLDGIQYFFTRRLTSQLGILERAIDTNNNTTQFTYITRLDVPLLSEIADPSGRRISLSYGNESSELWDTIVELRESVNNATPRIITYGYDANRSLISVTDNRSYNGITENIAKQYAYDNNNRLLTYTDPRGTILYNEYDGDGRVIKQRELNPRNPRLNADGNPPLIYELSYDDDGDPAVIGSTHCTLVKNYRDFVNHYDEYSCFNTDEQKIYNRKGDTIESWIYDARGMVSQKTDGLGNITTYQYDEQRRLTQEVLPDTAEWRTVATYEYWNNPNRLKTKTETTTSLVRPLDPAKVRVTTYTVPQDGRGNVSVINYPLNISEQFTYNPNGTVLNHTDKNGNVTTYQYDPTGNYPSREAITVVQADGSVQNIVSQYLYDVYGNRTSYVDPRRLTYTYQYDTHSNLRQERNPDNQIKTYLYDVEDHRIQMVDELRRTTLYTYDTDINASPLSVERLNSDGTRQIFRKAYDFVGNVISETDPLGWETRYVYDSANRLERTIGPVNTLFFVYDPAGRLTGETDIEGRRTDYLYDSRGQMTEQRRYVTGNSFVSNSFDYDGLGRRVSEIDGKGQATRYAYDAMDRLSQKTDSAGGVYEYAYDNAGNKTGERMPRAIADASLRNAQGYSTSFFYDAAGRLTKQINARNKETVYLYDANGNATAHTDRRNADGSAGNHVTRYTYDNLNRKRTETFADDGVVEYGYDEAGRLTSRQDQMGRIWTSVYDEYDRLTEEHDLSGASTTYEYDLAGNKRFVTYPDTTRTEYRYDAGNRLELVIDALGGVKRFTYDAVGNKLTETDKRTFTTFFEYDLLNRLKNETNPQGTLTVHTYDANSNRLSETVGVKTTGYEYDELNRVKTITYPGNKTERSTYDENGNKDSYTDGKDQTINFVYDALNRVSTKRVPNTAPITYSYDNWGNLTHLADESGSTDYTYNALNLLGAETKTITGLPLAKTISRTYNPAGQLATLTDAANRVMTYQYNNRGLLESVNYNNIALATYAYNNFGKPSGVIFANGVRTVYEYDELNRTKLIETKKADNTSLFKQEYSYDAESNRTQMIENASTTVVYAYDNLNQLTDVDYQNVRGVGADLTFRYDAYGNRINAGTPFGNSVYNYADNSNELQSVTYNNRLTVSSEFDRNGSLTRETYTRLGRNTKEVAYSWDTQNRLSSINYHVSSRPAFLPPLPDNTLNFAYDDTGNRTKKMVNSEASYYINDGLTVLNELDSAGSVTKSIISGLEQIAEIDGNGVITYVHQDVLGSAVLLTNQAGEVTQHYEYDPFGQILGISGIAETKYLFTGQEYDQESELYYYNARYYNPRLGRFISRDVMLGEDGDTLSRNSYVYVKNNPVKYTDSSGNIFETIWDIANDFYDVGRFIKNGVEIGYNSAVILYQENWGDDSDKGKKIQHQKNERSKNTQELKESGTDLVFDAGATLIPFVPAGSTKAVRFGAKYGDDAVDAVKGGKKAVNNLPNKNDGKWNKLKGDQGWKDENGNMWKKDKLHKDHWDISDKKGNKIKEVDFNGKELWPNGPKNKNKSP